MELLWSVFREFGIPDDKMVEIQDRFIELTYNLNPSVRQAAVWALGELNVHRKDAYLTVVRRLIDDDKDTREEAKRVLKKLTGILEAIQQEPCHPSSLVMNWRQGHLQSF